MVSAAAVAALLSAFAASAAADPAKQPEPSGPEWRTWTDSSGTFRTRANLLKIEEDKIHLEKADGKKIAVPLEKLSEADRQFAAAQRPTAPGNEAASDETGKDDVKPPAAGAAPRLAVRFHRSSKACFGGSGR